MKIKEEQEKGKRYQKEKWREKDFHATLFLYKVWISIQGQSFVTNTEFRYQVRSSGMS